VRWGRPLNLVRLRIVRQDVTVAREMISTSMRQVLLSILACFAFLGPAFAQPYPLDTLIESPEGPVFEVPIEGMIDKALANYLDRALNEAEEANASVVILHMDTFGGLVDAADQMRTAILNTDVPVVTFIDRNAASAGALISLASDRIVMVPGASIGAATVVSGGSGEAAPDKYQSYMRGQMRATAEATGRDPQIAEAMVDETLEVKGVSPAGQVLTLSAKEALDVGFADAIMESILDLTAALGVQQQELVVHAASGVERFLRFFASPIVQSILMMMMLGGLYFELQSPGVGFAGAMAAIGAALFFAPNYLTGLVESWEIAIFVLGVMLLLVEVFIVPGFGIPGIAGLIFVLGGLGAALIPNIGLDFPSGGEVSSAFLTLGLTLVLLIALGFSMGKYLPNNSRFQNLVLAGDLSSIQGYTSADSNLSLLGQTGPAITSLRPAGLAEIDGQRIDVVSQGDFIDAGTVVEVVTVKGSRVVVKRSAALPAAEA
ncbi:MAG: NfeD family protein, partial [Bacteroidota bacterium]